MTLLTGKLVDTDSIHYHDLLSVFSLFSTTIFRSLWNCSWLARKCVGSLALGLASVRRNRRHIELTVLIIYLTIKICVSVVVMETPLAVCSSVSPPTLGLPVECLRLFTTRKHVTYGDEKYNYCISVVLL